MSIEHLLIRARPSEDGKISHADLVDEIDAGARRLNALMYAIWSMSCTGSEINGEELFELTDLGRTEASRIRQLVNIWSDQQGGAA